MALAYSRIPGVIITTYGDLIRVPGSTTSLEKERAAGSDVRIVYSVLEALEIARINKGKKIVFLGIGFETTRRLPAVEHGQAHIHQDQIGRMGVGHLHAALAVDRQHDLVAFALEPAREHVTVHLVILDQ